METQPIAMYFDHNLLGGTPIAQEQSLSAEDLKDLGILGQHEDLCPDQGDNMECVLAGGWLTITYTDGSQDPFRIPVSNEGVVYGQKVLTTEELIELKREELNPTNTNSNEDFTPIEIVGGTLALFTTALATFFFFGKGKDSNNSQSIGSGIIGSPSPKTVFEERRDHAVALATEESIRLSELLDGPEFKERVEQWERQLNSEHVVDYNAGNKEGVGKFYRPAEIETDIIDLDTFGQEDISNIY